MSEVKKYYGDINSMTEEPFEISYGHSAQVDKAQPFVKLEDFENMRDLAASNICGYCLKHEHAEPEKTIQELEAKIAELEKELNCLPTGIDKEVFEDVCYERDDLFQKFSRAVEGLKEAHNTMSKIEKFGLGVNIEKNLVITNTADLLTSALDKIKQIRGGK